MTSLYILMHMTLIMSYLPSGGTTVMLAAIKQAECAMLHVLWEFT